MLHGGACGCFVITGAAARLGPCGATVLVASVVSKERADAMRAQVGRPKPTVAREQHWVREDGAVLVQPALEIAEDEGTAGDVVGKVREGLHDARPRRLAVVPAGVAVEFLEGYRFLEGC